MRCPEAAQAIKAADLLVRDGNLPLLILDLQFAPAQQLRRIPASTWYRFQRILEEKKTTTLIAFTPKPMIEAATLRLQLGTARPLTLRAMRMRRADLVRELQITSCKQRFQSIEATAPLLAQTA